MRLGAVVGLRDDAYWHGSLNLEPQSGSNSTVDCERDTVLRHCMVSSAWRAFRRSHGGERMTTYELQPRAHATHVPIGVSPADESHATGARMERGGNP